MGVATIESGPHLRVPLVGSRNTDERYFELGFEISYEVPARLDEHRERCQCFDAVSDRVRQARYRGLDSYPMRADRVAAPSRTSPGHSSRAFGVQRKIGAGALMAAIVAPE